MTPQLRLNRSLTHEAFPHACRPGELDFEVVEYSLDGESPVEPETDGTVDLKDYEGWDTASLKVKVDVSEDILDAVFPEDTDYPGRILVAGHCRATYLRDRTILSSSPVDPGSHSDEVELKVDAVGGVVELRPYLIRAETVSPVDDYGVDEGVMLADGREWTVEVTEDDAGGKNHLEVDRTSFEEKHEEDEDTRFPPKDEMYYLDLERDSANPVLWFNEDHREIVNLIWAGESDYDNLTANLVWNHVLTDVWTRMITIAAIEFEAEDSEWTPEWHAGVMDEASQHLFPELNPSARKAAQFLQEELREGGHVTATKRIESAVQEILDPASGFLDHVDRIGGE
ncbi:hypothetical protein [Haloarcula pellucida]|uniref:Uncharacterized protein n=1 Tax=Haloarcula pellucida TaxID=1427151 RepID=A0A830GQB5_9EURY|nr:hypothetical protein [Halomicroarcula pellucida]MBX0349019.1 hypothetical protein [Halomicroarcula pellucida]GGN98634.1 hypothetical protein GCM10009030_29240 [Halomicroarcula pellucida]